MELKMTRNDIDKTISYLKEYSGVCVTVDNVQKAKDLTRLGRNIILAREDAKSKTPRNRLKVIAYNLMIGMEEFSNYQHEEILDYVGLTESEYDDIMVCLESEDE